MKIVAKKYFLNFFCLFIFYSAPLFSQNKINIADIDFENPKNFEKYSISRISEYSYKISDKGKIKIDSTLEKEFIYNKNEMIISGRNRKYIHSPHGISHMEYYNFKNIYNKDSTLSKKIMQILGADSAQVVVKEEILKYNAEKNLIKKKYYSKKYLNDTISKPLSIEEPKEIVLEYDKENNIIKESISIDSTKYFKDGNYINKCVYCHSKKIYKSNIYKNNKLDETITYTHEETPHSKTKFIYNINNKIVRKVDSTGYYNPKPIFQKETNYLYTKDAYYEIVNSFNKKNTKKFDLTDSVIWEEELFLNSGIKNYTYHIYLKNEYLVNYIYNKNKLKIKRLYNNIGLLKEIKYYRNNVLIDVKRYFYE